MGVRSFKDAEWQKATPDAQLEKSIREGKKGTLMASFEKQFTPEEIKALVGLRPQARRTPQVAPPSGSGFRPLEGAECQAVPPS